MTASDPAKGKGAGWPRAAPHAQHARDEPEEPLVIRDRRKAGRGGGKHAKPVDPNDPAEQPEVAGSGPAEPASPPDPVTETAPPTAGAEQPPAGGFGAELEALRAELDERTRDLQRVTAEFANYKKRVERDRALAREEATASVFKALLPVLDDLDRAREHGELVEGIAAVAEQLVATTSKFGLTPFGEQGDPFDPNRHEAVAHLTSTEVNEPTCVDVLRRGYLLGDRLLRPAMVAVADPETPS